MIPSCLKEEIIMSSQRKAEAVASENIVTTETSRLSDLWKKEDWLAVWIGFIIIAIGAVAVLTGAFDFNAAKFSTWGHGTSFFEQVNAGFFGKLLLTVAVLGVLFTVGNHFKGVSVKKYLPAFLGLFLLAVLVRFISAEYTLNRYLEWAFFAILIGILVSNTVGVPGWLKPAIQTEFYIKVGLVIMGFSVLFSNIVNFGLYGLGIAWIVTPIVILFMWWFGTRVLKIDNKPFVITLTTATSVCGTSAAIAVGAGTALGETAQTAAVLVKSIQNILIGFIAFAVAVFFATKVENNGESSRKIGVSEIWYRLPKFILGFFAASLIASFIAVPAFGKESVSSINSVLDQYKNWAFVLAFTSIGLETNFREIKEQFQGGKPLTLYVVGQLFNIVLTFAAVYLLLSGKFFPLPNLAL